MLEEKLIATKRMIMDFRIIPSQDATVKYEGLEALVFYTVHRHFLIVKNLLLQQIMRRETKITGREKKSN